MERPTVQLGSCTLYQGDALDILPTLAENSLDACVTDPPYGLAFMGEKFDTLGDGPAQQAWHRRWAEAVYKVLKPGAFVVAFGGTRTHHRLMCALEDAGFELRDTLMYIYGSGWPKGGDVGKAIDKAAGAEREIVGYDESRGHYDGHARQDGQRFNGVLNGGKLGGHKHNAISTPATEAAQQWQGFASSLKPAYEPIVLARKKLEGTVVENVLRWGCGALNIDACRVGTESISAHGYPGEDKMGAMKGKPVQGKPEYHLSSGRWPANVVIDDSAEVMAGFPQTTSGQPNGERHADFNWGRGVEAGTKLTGFGDTGSAARFFYTSKASPSDRGEGNIHPCCKPTNLMRWLLRLALPPGGICLDLFAGSGTTGVAAIEEGYRCLLIEREPVYVAIMRRRIEAATRQPDLFRTPPAAVPNVPNPQPSLFAEE